MECFSQKFSIFSKVLKIYTFSSKVLPISKQKILIFLIKLALKYSFNAFPDNFCNESNIA